MYRNIFKALTLKLRMFWCLYYTYINNNDGSEAVNYTSNFSIFNFYFSSCFNSKDSVPPEAVQKIFFAMNIKHVKLSFT